MLQYPIQDRNIRGGKHIYWCVSILRYNGHVYIFHQEHLWYLRDIFCWWMRCISTGLKGRHQFSSIPSSAAAASMVSSARIMLALTFFTLLLIGSVFGTSCVEFWQNMRSGDVSLPHSSVGSPIMRLQEAPLKFTNAFWYPPPRGLLEDFYWFIFLNASASSLSLEWVGQSLFP